MEITYTEQQYFANIRFLYDSSWGAHASSQSTSQWYITTGTKLSAHLSNWNLAMAKYSNLTLFHVQHPLTKSAWWGHIILSRTYPTYHLPRWSSPYLVSVEWSSTGWNKILTCTMNCTPHKSQVVPGAYSTVSDYLCSLKTSRSSDPFLHHSL